MDFKLYCVVAWYICLLSFNLGTYFKKVSKNCLWCENLKVGPIINFVEMWY